MPHYYLRLRTIIWLLAGLLSYCYPSVAVAAGEVALVNLTYIDGLAGESVYRVMTDHNGRVWLATTNGVSKYNGKKMVSFSLTDEKRRSITVTDLCETADHSIYAATDIGLFRLKYGAEQFEHILPEVLHPECLLADGDSVYIGGRQGLQLYDGKHLRTRQVGPRRKDLDNIVRQYQKDQDGNIWFLGRYTLNRYDSRTDSITTINLPQLPENVALSQFALAAGRVFIGTQGFGLFTYQLSTGETRKVEEVSNVVTSVSTSPDGYVCVATNGGGAWLLNASSLKTEAHFGTHETDCELPTNALNCYYRDACGVNWFGLIRFGLAYTYRRGTLFQPYASGSFTTLGRNVRSYCLREGEAVIGLQNGFYFLSESAQTARYFSPEELGGGHIVTSVVYDDGVYYIGTYDGGLWVFNPRTMQISRQDIDPKLDEASIGDLKVSAQDGSLWIGSSEGLFIRERSGRVLHFTEQNSHIVGGQIVSIAFNHNGDAWLTGKGGLSYFSSRTKSIVDVYYPAGFFNDQPWMRISSGHDGYMYMRTGPQVFYTDEQLKDYGELRMPIRFSDDWTRDFIDDFKGHYWVSSEMGLFRFGYGDERGSVEGMLHFGYGEGLLGDHINDMSIDAGGVLWVATSEGLFRLSDRYQEGLSANSPGKVHLFNIRRGIDLLSDGQEYVANEEQRIGLSWTFASEMLQMEPVLMDFTNHRGRLYQYQIDDDGWQTITDGSPIMIRGLGLGRHQLTVRLAGVEATASAYSIHVTPSWVVLLTGVLLLVALLLLYRWYQYHKNTNRLLSERDEIEDALVQVEKELEDKEEADGFFDERSGRAERHIRPNGEPKEDEVEPAQKYQRVRIDEAECADIVSRMRKYIEAGKLYTNSDLKMKDLADVLHLSPSKLSQIFNLYLKENYYDFINRYRLDEFKRLIEAGEYKSYTITAISERCGFKKSSFFSTFRKVEGVTPAEYLKNKGIKS